MRRAKTPPPSPIANRLAMEAESQVSVDSMRRRSNSKRPKTSGIEDKALDLISDLPDGLLLHILTFLPPNVAVKTNILSKRWRFLWTYIPVLDFKEKHLNHRWNGHVHMNTDNTKRFISFVNHTLVLHQTSKIQKFSVQFEYMDAFASDVDVWLLFATQNNVVDLQLDFYDAFCSYCRHDDKIYSLPLYVLNNSSLVTLTLAQCLINHLRYINWKSLKVLKCYGMSMSNVLIQHILSASPSLEIFELHCCYEYDCIDLTSSGLKALFIDQHGRTYRAARSNTILTITAPNLQSLKVIGKLWLKKIRVNNLHSVIDVSLDFDLLFFEKYNSEQFLEVYPKILKVLFKNLRRVKDLTVGSWCLQVLLQMEGNALPSPLSTLGCLRINTKFSKWDLPGITKLLALTPVLETLVIVLSSSKMYFMFDEYDDIGFEESYEIDENNYWSSSKTSFELALENLKTVKIVDFIGEERSIKFILFLLKNARQLEKMVIHYKPEKVKKSPVEVAQILFSCPRCSPNLVIFFS